MKITQPRVGAAATTLGAQREIIFNPNGVASSGPRAATVSGLMMSGRVTQGSSFLATLGWKTQSLWDWLKSDLNLWVIESRLGGERE